MNENRQVGLELSAFMRAIWRRRQMVALISVLPALLSGLYMMLRPAVYECNALLDPGVVWNLPVDGPGMMAEVVMTDAFLDRMIHQVSWLESSGFTPETMRRGMINVRISQAGFVAIRLRANTPEHAAELAQAVTSSALGILRTDYMTAHDNHAKQVKAMEDQLRGATRLSDELSWSRGRHGDVSMPNMAAVTVMMQSLAALGQGLDVFTREPRVLAAPVAPKEPLGGGSVVATLLFSFLASLLTAAMLVVLLDF